jgi:nucleoside-diphosphate-sugar epimerase
VSAKEEGLMRVNGAATEQLLKLCKEHGVKSFVYCCSCSAVMDARRSTWDGCTADELSYPPAEHFLNDYGRSKAAGERAVLANNIVNNPTGTERTFCTCSLRVSCMLDAKDQGYGSLMALGFPNFVYFGEGTQVVDFVWSLDVARALVQAACTSAKSPERVGGRAFHIGGLGRPLALKEWATTWDDAANRYLWGSRLPPLWIPRWSLRLIAQINFRTFQMLGVAPISPLIRPDTVVFTDGSLSYWFDLKPAKDAFGYEPSSVREVIVGIRDEVLGALAKQS